MCLSVDVLLIPVLVVKIQSQMFVKWCRVQILPAFAYSNVEEDNVVAVPADVDHLPTFS